MFGRLVRHLTYKRFYGDWEVLQYAGTDKYNNTLVKAKCACGNIKLLRLTTLKRGYSTGCQKCKSGLSSRKIPLHGHYVNGRPSPTYNSWYSMQQRCRCEKHPHYNMYGGRGIKVCKAWESFSRFLHDMGIRPKGMTLDRIDPDGNYTKANCRWASPRTQRLNQRKLRLGGSCDI